MFRMANVGTADQVVRLILAAATVLVAVYTLAALWNWAAYVVAAILALTAIVRFCPAYALFGVSTCESPKRF
ncbi:YgaP family membrane protein [Mangrovicella endophytica]|uniref:YgaP family membrane protein n=1 Tax=Mangrovicella endophytica TaxID=2066697 RepID=UPI0018E41D4E|nr:DUF2892 domain-containing protein [Mangrovicella endophytica]